MIHALGKSFGIADFHGCERKSYSGALLAQSDTFVRAFYGNSRQPNLPKGDQDVIYMMMCSPLSALEGMKVFIRDDIAKLCPPGLVLAADEAL